MVICAQLKKLWNHATLVATQKETLPWERFATVFIFVCDSQFDLIRTARFHQLTSQPCLLTPLPFWSNRHWCCGKVLFCWYPIVRKLVCKIKSLTSMVPQNVLVVAFYQCLDLRLNAQIETFKPMVNFSFCPGSKGSRCRLEIADFPMLIVLSIFV